MYTINETLAYVAELDKWGGLIDQWQVEGRTAIVWSEEVENKHGPDVWRTAYVVRYWEDGKWLDTKFFTEEWAATEFARDFANKPNRFPYPTD